jgi:hypothetical protein
MCNCVRLIWCQCPRSTIGNCPLSIVLQVSALYCEARVRSILCDKCSRFTVGQFSALYSVVSARALLWGKVPHCNVGGVSVCDLLSDKCPHFAVGKCPRSNLGQETSLKFGASVRALLYGNLSRSNMYKCPLSTLG